MPPDNAVGFAPADWALFLITGLFLLAAFACGPRLKLTYSWLANRRRTCVILLFLLPISLRLLLLPHHPVPTPDIYDEFSQLLLADTLLHGRLANPSHPMHRFFETFFVLQEPTYSSMYPLGQGFVLALGRLLSGTPWTGVLLATGAFCGACYWMLRGWVSPNWALLGGIFAVIEFGPLCQWTNSYWGGGSFAALGGSLVFGALPRLREYARPRDALLLGTGFGIHMLTRQFESLLLLIAVVLFFAPELARREKWASLLRISAFASLAVIPVALMVLAQNRAVTHSLTTLPEQLHQYQYGIPVAFTFEQNATPHVPLTAQQERDYKAESLQHGPGTDTLTRFLLRLEYRVRYYRFFFLPPLYLAIVAFFFALREAQLRWVTATLAIFALGTNFFPYLLLHYLAAVTGLFVLVSVIGLRQFSRLRVRNTSLGVEIAAVLIVLCIGEFISWYGMHLFESPSPFPILRYETWDSINHENPQRRIEVNRRLAAISGQLLVFVHYSPRHIYQNEWVWNEADIDNSRIVFARDLGPEEDEKLIRYYPNRKMWLLEPDEPVPQLSAYAREPGR
jgi:hypothetical protein